jgi:hypothetical protein
MLDEDLPFTDPPPAENLTPETSILICDYWLRTTGFWLLTSVIFVMLESQKLTVPR